MDRLLRYIKDIRQATLFDIQNVSDYYFTYPEDGWRFDKFTIAPPFPFFATRYLLPDSMPDGYRGSEILTVFRQVEHAPKSSIGQVLSENNEINPYPASLVYSAKWHLQADLFSAYKRQITPPLTWFFAVNEYGQVDEYLSYPAIWITDMPDARIGIIPNTFMQISCLALTFLHCRNVEILEPPAASKKRLPRKVKFESRYHRLKVNAIGVDKRSSSSGGLTGIKQGLSITRGHFREYGPEFGKGKLFGKLSGRFWVAGFLKGDPERGVIEKDYEIGGSTTSTTGVVEAENEGEG